LFFHHQRRRKPAVRYRSYENGAGRSTAGGTMFDPSKLGEMMQQAQQMQERMQAQLREKAVVGSAGGGMVKVSVNGLYEVLSVSIDKAAIDPADPAMLEDLVRAAVSQALAKVEEQRLENARAMAGTMGLPGGLF
jgi:DNA-binding YbaB/EbfC family protein